MSAALPVRSGASALATPLSLSPVASLVAVAALAFAAFWPSILREGDTWWHLAAGDWVLAHRAAPRLDPFSFSFAGKPWVAHEWLAEALMAASFRVAGWGGLTLLTASAFAATLGIVAQRTLRQAGALAGALALLFVALLIIPSLTARPHMLAMPLVALWADRLVAAREAKRAPPLMLAALMALWANLHGGFAFGLALVLPFAAEAALEAEPNQRLAVAARWLGFFALSLAAALITPFGVEGLLFPIKLLGVETLSHIGEWQPQDFSHFGAMEAALLLTLFLGLATPLKLPPIRAALFVALVFLALGHARHETLFGVVGAMLIAAPVGALIKKTDASPAPQPLAAFAPALFPALIVAAFRLMSPIERVDGPSAPIAALAAVPEALRERPVLNDYDFGGYLIAEGVRPFIDGRTDLYGDAFITRFVALGASEAALQDEIAKDDIAWTIFRPDRPIVALLDREPGWKRLFANATAVVHVRAEPEEAPFLRR